MSRKLPTSMSGEFDVSGGGIGVTADPAALQDWSRALLADHATTFRLADSKLLLPAGWRPLHNIEVRPGESIDGGVSISIDSDGLVMTGGRAALERLADHLARLSETPYRMGRGSVPSHVNLDYYDGHPYLADSDRWLTVTRAPEG